MTQGPDPTPRTARRWPARLAVTAGGVALATIAALVGISAAASDPTSTVYACVESARGTVRIVSATAACDKGETLHTWNVTGPTGPQGPAGPQGEPGHDGAGAPIPHQLVVGTMTVSGITGPNADGSIDLLSFEEGLTVPTIDGSGGTGAGKPTFSDVTLAKLVDAASPPLLGAAAAGRHLAQVVIHLVEPGSSIEVASYALTEVVVSSDRIADDGSSPAQLLETFQLHFRTITVTVDGATFTYDTSGVGA